MVTLEQLIEIQKRGRGFVTEEGLTIILAMLQTSPLPHRKADIMIA